MIVSTLFAFLYIFSFPINNISHLDSSIILGVILLCFVGFSTAYRRSLLRIFKFKRIYEIIGMISLVALYSWINTTLAGARDYSFIQTLFHQMIMVVIGVFLVAYLYYRKVDFLEVIILSFFIQSAIQIISLISEPFREATNIFRPENAITIGQWKYSGIRGLAISGSAFFGLSVSYGLVFILWALYRKEIFRQVSPALKMVMLASMLVGGMSAGRTSLIGFAIGFFIYIFPYLKTKVRMKISLNTMIIFLAILVALAFILSRTNILESEQVESLNQFVTEFARNGSTTSGTELFTKMYFPVDFNTFILGVGKYTTETGLYYMNTDAGYMRDILYFGIIGLFQLFYLQRLYLYNDKTSHSRLSLWAILLYIIIVQIKGEVAGFLIIFESILFIVYFRNMLRRKTNYMH